VIPAITAISRGVGRDEMMGRLGLDQSDSPIWRKGMGLYQAVMEALIRDKGRETLLFPSHGQKCSA
jgi:hypothetical protein